MTRGSDRRDVLRKVAGFAILPILGPPIFALSTRPAEAAGLRVAPGLAFTLHRELEREISGGKAIIVRRAWACRFEKVGRGLGVSGSQISASVEAPPSLGAFAAIEERRQETGFLPQPPWRSICSRPCPQAIRAFRPRANSWPRCPIAPPSS